MSLIPLLLLLFVPFAFAGENEILGLWDTAEKDCKFEILKCGYNYCGKIAWLKEPYYKEDDEKGMAGKPVVDRENPNRDLRDRPLIGLQLMEGFVYMGENVWDKGTIYNPNNGKTYRCKMTLASPHRLEVKGFIGIPLFGKTSVWTR